MTNVITKALATVALILTATFATAQDYKTCNTLGSIVEVLLESKGNGVTPQIALLAMVQSEYPVDMAEHMITYVYSHTGTTEEAYADFMNACLSIGT